MPQDLDMKTKIESILTEQKADQKRARTMDIDDFMEILHAFNADGIHFA